MIRRTVLVAGGALLLALLAAGSAAVLWSDRGSADGAQPPPTGISATTSLEPRIVLFGDTLRARVDVVVDRDAVDPGSVRVAWVSAPWRLVRPPERTEVAAGRTAHVRVTYVLRCLTRGCAPAQPTETVAFTEARVSYLGQGATSPQSADVAWPSLLLHSRLGSLDVSQADALSAPWQADLVSVPAVSYRVLPGVAIGALLALAALLFAIAAAIVYRSWPRREPAPEPAPPPPPVASALEQALALLESSTSTNGNESRRRALELVADEVERAGDRELALAARALAWSPHPPELPTTRALAGRLRDRLEVDGAAG